MRISFDNNYLFTAGRDGTLVIHEIRDRDPRGGTIKRNFGSVLQFSEEILTEKSEMEEFDNLKETLENELQAARDPASGVDSKMGSNEQDQQIAHLQEVLSNSQLNARNKYDQLNSAKQDMEENYETQIKLLHEQQQEELEARKTEYNTKMLEDAAKYNVLQQMQQLDQNSFAASQQKIYEEHTSTVNTHMKNHNDFVSKQRTLIEQLKKQIDRMKKDNLEMMDQIMQDAKTEYDEIERKNNANLAHVKEMGLKANAEL
jgi:cilia- and flagella-associated protein 57